jgi:uncharacterized protein YprB with RNaseH-like and TPR domain
VADTVRFDRLSRISALAPARRCDPIRESVRGDEAARDAVLGAEVARNRYGEYLVARQWYATPEMCVPDARVLRLLLPGAAGTPRRAASQRTAASAGRRAGRADRRSADYVADCVAGHAAGSDAYFAADVAADHSCDPMKWLFLDIETTGLAGGTGTYAFLVGLAWWDGGGITVEQLFMRDHAEEHSVLLEIASRVRERPVLVTFNGKSFDWPLLETRFRMTRAIDPPEIAAHLDMLHPARQLWRVKLGTARLAELEERVLGAETLGWSRSADIDSSRIPEFYFNYLRGGSAEPLAGVFRHNRWDLRGLAALAGRIFRSLADPETIEPGTDGALELYGVSRLLCRRGEHELAQGLYERALAAGLPRQVDRRARHELARLVKRRRNFARAADLWQELSHELAGDGGPSFEACEQLAIHYERRVGDPREAARVARYALGELRRAQRLGLIPPLRHAYFAARFARRLARLEMKLGRARAACAENV